MEGSFRINGHQKSIVFGSEQTLLQVLRDNGHSEVKEGCDEGACGSCVVLLNGRLVNSCQVLAGSAVGGEIVTIKGLGDLRDPHPLQQAFVDAGAVQCGFCTPGMILAAYSLLRDNRQPTEGDIKAALDGNLCRCTGYTKIITAVRSAAERLAANA